MSYIPGIRDWQGVYVANPYRTRIEPPKESYAEPSAEFIAWIEKQSKMKKRNKLKLTLITALGIIPITLAATTGAAYLLYMLGAQQLSFIVGLFIGGFGYMWFLETEDRLS